MKHKHDWQQTGEVKIPTGKYAYSASHNDGVPIPLYSFTFDALVFICRGCEKIKVRKIEDLKDSK